MLQIRLLAQFDVRLDGKRVVISSRAGQSLLAYLAMTAGTAHRREKLAGTLWPESSEENARKNLRQELWRIRKAIPAPELAPENHYLHADEFTLTFNPLADYWLDVAILEKPEFDLHALTSSLSLYQGELLPGFYDNWVMLERERLRTLFESKMEQLVDHLVDLERWTAVQEQCEHWLALGQAPEPAYRALMLSYNARGDMAKVSSIYQRCAEDLRVQFGVEPSTETHALFNGLLKGAKVPRRIQPAQPSGTVTFMFTDIEGSTSLLDRLGENYAIALAEHHRILREAIQKWKGSEIDTQGDAFFVTFTRALDAVSCSVEAQRKFAEHSWPLDVSIRVRIGLHTGEPLIASTGYVGMDVHRAARIGDAGHGGQILLSRTTRDLVMQDLPPGITIKDLGEHRLKDMKYPTPIYQLVIEGLQVDFPPIKMKFSGSEAPAPGEPPFKGLQYFEEADSDLFFGRELLTAKLIRRLQDTQFLSVVIGASGSGKSSLVRAGLIPALKKGATLLDGTKPPQGSTDWEFHIITPTAHPLEALATELTSDSVSVAATARLIDDLAQEPRSLALFLARVSPKRHTVLVVDQFEELFTLCRDEFEREAFIDNLLNLVSPGQSSITLILTLRADFYAHLAQFPELRNAVAQQQEYIGPMTTEELRLAIEEPARRGHWEFEPGLVDLILRDVGDEPGALPLLSHALLETWKRRAGHTLILKGYVDAGGVHGAIAHTAESIYQRLPVQDQEIARDIFLRLTELGEGTEDTRRRASFDELISHTEHSEEVRKVLNQLADARLITLGDDTVEVAHEALIREWPTLREWLNQDREGLRLHRHLTEAAYEWELLGRDPGSMYRGAHLSQAREWAALHPNTINLGEREFLEASIQQEQREEQEREEQRQRELEAAQKLAETERARAEEQTHSANRLRIRNGVITTVGSVAVILALIAGLFGVQSNQQRTAALKAQADAEANFRQAEAQRLAAEANRLLLSGGNPELIALLSLRSVNIQYSPQGISALNAASSLGYPEQYIVGPKMGFSIAISPDGKYLVIGGVDHSVRLYNAKTGLEIRKFVGHTETVGSVEFSPDGKYIVSASTDARIWDTTTGNQVRQFTSKPELMTYAVFSPDGKYILAGTSARIWEIATGKELRQFVNQSGKVINGAFSHDGRFILTGNDDGSINLWNAQTSQIVRNFYGHKSSVLTVCFSSDDKFVLSGSQDSTARLWDAATGQELLSFTTNLGSVNRVAFSLDDKIVFTVSGDGTARSWDVSTGRELQRYPSSSAVYDAAISPDGKSIWTISFDGTARLWSIKPGAELPIFQDGSAVNGLAFSSDGKFILTGDTYGVARLWNTDSGQLLREFKGHTDVVNYGVAFSPDGRKVITSSWDKTVRIWDIATGQELYRFVKHTGGVNSVAFLPYSNFILSSGSDAARTWDPDTGQERLVLTNGNINDAATSPDGKYIATASSYDDGTALWDASDGRMLHNFTGTSGIETVTFSPDGKYLLSTDFYGTGWLWEIQTGKMLRQLVGHSRLISRASYSPDGKYVATASIDGTARLWDAQTGQEVRRLISNTAAVENVIFSPDGKYLLTGSDDGTARLWDVDYHTTMAYLCSRLLRDFTTEERAQYGIKDDAPTCQAK